MPRAHCVRCVYHISPCICINIRICICHNQMLLALPLPHEIWCAKVTTESRGHNRRGYSFQTKWHPLYWTPHIGRHVPEISWDQFPIRCHFLGLIGNKRPFLFWHMESLICWACDFDVNSIDTYIREYIRSSLVQVITCRLFRAKP